MGGREGWRWQATAPAPKTISVIEPAEPREGQTPTHPFGFSRALREQEGGGSVLDGSTPVDELLVAAGPGWPRAMLKVTWKPRAYPLAWVNSWKPALEHNGFKQLDKGRWDQADKERLCFCCGESLGKLQVMGRHRASFEDAKMTDGPAGHPRCVALAAEHCPHLRTQHKGDESFVIAFVWDGDGLGYVEVPEDMVTEGAPRLVVRAQATDLTLAQLRQLALEDPLGAG